MAENLHRSIYRKNRMRALVRDNFTCQYPGCTEDHLPCIEAHHIIPVNRGGSDDASNLLTMCRDHHKLLHDWGVPRPSLQTTLRMITFHEL